MPPNSRPKRNINVPPMIRNTPAQSMLRIPAMNGVLGDSILRKKKSATNETPPTGRFSQKHHLQVTLVVKAPPIMGPRAPAIAQIAPKIP